MVHTVHHNIVHHTVVLSTVASRNWQEKASWLDFQRRGLERRHQDDDVKDVHALHALHAGWGGGEEGGVSRVEGGGKRTGSFYICYIFLEMVTS